MFPQPDIFNPYFPSGIAEAYLMDCLVENYETAGLQLTERALEYLRGHVRGAAFAWLDTLMESLVHNGDKLLAKAWLPLIPSLFHRAELRAWANS